MGSSDDRYTMPPLDGPAQFADKLRELERRLEELERGTTSGTFTAADDDGNDLVYVGALPDGTRGLEIVSAALGWDLVKMTTEGWLKPHLMAVSIDPTASKSTTSATFATQYTTYFGEAFGPGVEAFFSWSTGAGTTGEVRLGDNNGGTTNAQSLPAASSGYYFVRWLHTLAVGAGPFNVSLDVRRTGGANSVAVSPLMAWVQDPSVCSSVGVFEAV